METEVFEEEYGSKGFTQRMDQLGELIKQEISDDIRRQVKYIIKRAVGGRIKCILFNKTELKGVSKIAAFVNAQNGTAAKGTTSAHFETDRPGEIASHNKSARSRGKRGSAAAALAGTVSEDDADMDEPLARMLQYPHSPRTISGLASVQNAPLNSSAQVGQHSLLQFLQQHHAGLPAGSAAASATATEAAGRNSADLATAATASCDVNMITGKGSSPLAQLPGLNRMSHSPAAAATVAPCHHSKRCAPGSLEQQAQQKRQLPAASHTTPSTDTQADPLFDQELFDVLFGSLEEPQHQQQHDAQESHGEDEAEDTGPGAFWREMAKDIDPDPPTSPCAPDRPSSSPDASSTDPSDQPPASTAPPSPDPAVAPGPAAEPELPAPSPGEFRAWAKYMGDGHKQLSPLKPTGAQETTGGEPGAAAPAAEEDTPSTADDAHDGSELDAAVGAADRVRACLTTAQRDNDTDVNRHSNIQFEKQVELEATQQSYYAHASYAAVLRALQLLLAEEALALGPSEIIDAEVDTVRCHVLKWCGELLQSPAWEVYAAGWHGSAHCQLLLQEERHADVARGVAEVKFLPGSTHLIDEVLVCLCCCYGSCLLGFQELPIFLHLAVFEQRLGLQEGELLKLVQLLAKLDWELWETELLPDTDEALQQLYKQRHQQQPCPAQHHHTMQTPARAIHADAVEFVSPPGATAASAAAGEYSQRWDRLHHRFVLQGPWADQVTASYAADGSLDDAVDAAYAAAAAVSQPYFAAHKAVSDCKAALKEAEEREGSTFKKLWRLEPQCTEAEGRAAHLAALQLLQANTNVDERPSEQEARDLGKVAALMLFADAGVYVLGWRIFVCCKPAMAELQLGDSDRGLGVHEAFQGRALLLVCCWTASKVAGASKDVPACADVAAAVRMACTGQHVTSVHTSGKGVRRLEAALLKVFVNHVLPGYERYLRRLGLVSAEDAVLQERCQLFGKGWYLCV